MGIIFYFTKKIGNIFRWKFVLLENMFYLCKKFIENLIFAWFIELLTILTLLQL